MRAQGERGPPMLQQLRKSAKKAQRLKITQNVSFDPIFNCHIKIDMSGFQKTVHLAKVKANEAFTLTILTTIPFPLH